MTDSKKTHFPAPPILNIFSCFHENFNGLVLGLVELIDEKGIGVAQLGIHTYVANSPVCTHARRYGSVEGKITLVVSFIDRSS